MSIFDNITRDDDGTPHRDETAFAYLNRSGRNQATQVRSLIDDWLGRYPKRDRDALTARLRSSIDYQHQSAFFELFLHQLMLANGHRILAIEPTLSHTTKSPDFLIETRRRERFYLEGVLATGRSQDRVAAQARLNQALAAIDKTSSPRHFLDLRVRGLPSQPVSINRMRRALEAWIDGLPDDETAFQVAPFRWLEHGVNIRLQAFPRHNRQRARRSIGVEHFPMRQETPHEDLRDAINKKASRYGTLDFPYAVAVNAFGLFTGEDDALDALLGTPAYVVRQMADGSAKGREERNPDGVWNGPGGARKRGLSAVLSTSQITPWNFASRRARIIRNVWATAPLPHATFGIDEVNPVEKVWRKTAGAKVGHVLGLPDGWPLE